MKFYKYFSDIIASEIDLPELMEAVEDDYASGFLFRLSGGAVPFFPKDERVHHWRLPADDSITLSFAQNKDLFLLDFPGIARFSIGQEDKIITGYPLAGTPDSTMRHLLLDQVLPRLFAHFYNFSILHASSVEVAGHSICFLGDTGWGKSTLATGFTSAGYKLMTDDCIQIFSKDNTLYSIASYNTIRLLPDAIEALNVTGGQNAELAAHYSSKKRLLRPENTKVLPVASFFLLTQPSQCRELAKARIEVVPKAEAIIALLKNSFCLDLHDTQFLQLQFINIAAVTTSGMPIYSLGYQRTFAKLQTTVQAILQVLHTPPPLP